MTFLPSFLHVFVFIVASVTSLRAVVEITSGDSRIFSGESVRLKCSVPDVHLSDWKYLWFRGSDRLPQIEEHLVIWKSKVKHSGKYHCQGVRNTVVRNIHTLKSLPLEINVDGKISSLRIISIEISLIYQATSFLFFTLLLL